MQYFIDHYFVNKNRIFQIIVIQKYEFRLPQILHIDVICFVYCHASLYTANCNIYCVECCVLQRALRQSKYLTTVICNYKFVLFIWLQENITNGNICLYFNKFPKVLKWKKHIYNYLNIYITKTNGEKNTFYTANVFNWIWRYMKKEISGNWNTIKTYNSKALKNFNG